MTRAVAGLRRPDIFVLAFAVLSLSRAAKSPAQTPLARRATLTVFAAASLTESFGQLGKLFERRHPGLAVHFNFAGSQQLVAQLEQGAGADVFAAADERSMKLAGDRQLLEGEPRRFAGNRLVVIVPSSNPAGIDRLERLADSGHKIVLASEAVPAGKYSREMLTRLSAAPGFDSSFARRVLANVVSEEENVKAVVAKVQLAEADAGIVYRSDVTATVAPRVRVLEIPKPFNVAATYPIARMKDSSEPKLAREFIDLVLSREGQDVLRRFGFEAAASGAGANGAAVNGAAAPRR